MVVRERQTDLVIIEGMGRAIHTNYYAMLSCESLKMAVIKNSWLADRLGGKLFSVVFKYEVPAGKVTGQDSAPSTPLWARGCFQKDRVSKWSDQTRLAGALNVRMSIAYCHRGMIVKLIAMFGQIFFLTDHLQGGFTFFFYYFKALLILLPVSFGELLLLSRKGLCPWS